MLKDPTQKTKMNTETKVMLYKKKPPIQSAAK
jgi:hypothetical protein